MRDGNVGHGSSSDASAAALRNCAQRGAYCQVLTTFNNACFAIAVQDGGNGYSWKTNTDLSAAHNAALRECTRMGLSCSIQASFCDSVAEVSTTVICVRPVFEQEMGLRGQVDGDPSRTRRIAAAILYLRREFCRSTSEQLASDSETHVSDNCWELSGLYRGERVYWGECRE